MKTKIQFISILSVLFAGVHLVMGQLPVISSFGQNGILVCTNLQPGTVAGVEWASSLAGPWQTNWAGLDAVTVNSNATISVSVPMFYRVRGVVYIPPTTADGMALIPAGSFTMGNYLLDGNTVTDDPDITDATPTNVYVSAFYMDTNLVSYSQWQSVYNWAASHGYSFDNAGSGKAANHPVQFVNWYDVVKWSNARSQQAGLTPAYYTDVGFTQVYTNGEVTPFVNWAVNGYRLPSEAEWEKAARGGLSGQRFPWGNTISENQANYNAAPGSYSYDVNSYSGYNTNYNTGDYPYTSPVGDFAPNGYGLYDMAGNVWAWCWDWYDGMPYGQPTTNNPTGPTGPASGSGRVVRGGGWPVLATGARCANRLNCGPDARNQYSGLRCVRGQ